MHFGRDNSNAAMDLGLFYFAYIQLGVLVLEPKAIGVRACVPTETKSRELQGRPGGGVLQINCRL